MAYNTTINSPRHCEGGFAARGNPFSCNKKNTVCHVAFALPVCGARQKQRLTKQARFLPTAAHAALSLLPPPAALKLASRKDVESAKRS